MGRFVYEIDIASWYVKPLKWTTDFEIVDGEYEISEKMSLAEKPYDSLVFYQKIKRSEDYKDLKFEYFCRPIEQEEVLNFDNITNAEQLRTTFFKDYGIKKFPMKETIEMLGLNVKEIEKYVDDTRKKTGLKW